MFYQLPANKSLLRVLIHALLFLQSRRFHTMPAKHELTTELSESRHNCDLSLQSSSACHLHSSIFFLVILGTFWSRQCPNICKVNTTRNCYTKEFVGLPCLKAERRSPSPTQGMVAPLKVRKGEMNGKCTTCSPKKLYMLDEGRLAMLKLSWKVGTASRQPTST